MIMGRYAKHGELLQKRTKCQTVYIYNEMGFLQLPPEMKLCAIGGRFVALRIPFMQIQNLPWAVEKLISGSAVTMPVDIASTFNILPINNSYNKIQNKKNKRCEFNDNIYGQWLC